MTQLTMTKVIATKQITLSHIDKTYLVGEKPLHVLNDISLSIEAGEYISIMGPSGSGKSTLLNMIGLLDRVDNGSLVLENTETTVLTEEQRAKLRRNSLGFIFQNFQLISRLTALENAELPLVLAGVDANKRSEIVTELFESLGLADRLQHLPKQLSGGQLQRVAIARAMVMSPKILLADEPTGNLDQKSGKEVVGVLEELNRQGITLIMVTHDHELGARANRQLQMVDGVIVADSATCIEIGTNK
ncbi:ABC transporter ATP-binding protein [Colwellia sp. 12G3]|uniref:ABC transporter ATP-binding protein n=1 Tax=Colwellia sp. 12G3 TaxID=2058299 RepID=UPI000C32E14E|nr:ABC transporter ATP-binding protein [Colwellia sp. 12G3]PKI17668.1 macrolide ABC transporter ATP-binding protein [Colwellia sp. 12G3]